jgi:hypothetical protein
LEGTVIYPARQWHGKLNLYLTNWCVGGGYCNPNGLGTVLVAAAALMKHMGLNFVFLSGNIDQERT